MSNTISTTMAVAALRSKAQAGTLDVALAHALDGSGNLPDILVIAHSGIRCRYRLADSSFLWLVVVPSPVQASLA